jgi:hypothetical protein
MFEKLSKRERAKLDKALAVLRNPAPGVKLVSHGWVSGEERAREDLVRAAEAAFKDGLLMVEVAKLVRDGYVKANGGRKDIRVTLTALPTPTERIEAALDDGEG